MENFQDLIVALDACYWPQKAISISLSRFGDDRRCDLADFKPVISWFSEDFMYCLALSLCVYFYLRVKEICSSLVDLLKWKKSSITSVWWTLLPGRGARPKSKERNLASSLLTLFSPQVYIRLQTVPVRNAYAQINLLSGKGKTDRKSRTATVQWEFHQSYGRRNILRSSLCGHWSERGVAILLLT